MWSEWKKIIKEELAFHPSDLIVFERENGISFITASSMKDINGWIIIQTELMAQVLGDSTTACQTDPIVWFVTNDFHPSVNICVTSTYCPIRMRYYPTQFGILYGKTHHHYAFYFTALIESMKFCDYNHFTDTYLRMICDFSDTMWLSFCLALCNIFGIEGKDCCLESISAFCQVNFQRPTYRVQQNYETVQSNRGIEFKWLAQQLLDVMQVRINFKRTLMHY